MKILITGARGFIGRNLVAALRQETDVKEIIQIGRQESWSTLADGLAAADFVYHLAGVNRPDDEAEFVEGNAQLTERICDYLLTNERAIPVVFSSSSQAALDNAYGRSKRQAEDALRAYAEKSGAAVTIYQLPGVFGKWSRPHYNSVVATFCHSIARDLPVTINDAEHVLKLVYIDDVVKQFVENLRLVGESGVSTPAVEPVHEVALGALADQIRTFRASRQTLFVPNFDTPFDRKLYATYLSYLPEDDFGYQLQKRSDVRGSLAEFIKLPAFGQIFVSRTEPGITRGDHYHHTKTEKFLVLEGEATVRFRALDGSEIIEYPVVGKEYQVVDIPPGYTHSIENTGKGELVTLFWASEVFDPQLPDTYYVPVLPREEEIAQ